MQNVYETSKKMNKHEVFYGRCNARSGLFEVDEDKRREELEMKQKNRSGRSTKKNVSDCLYFAHTLLNVHNPKPLASGLAKIPKSDDEFRLKKLVRHANRAKVMKYNKYLQKQQLMKVKVEQIEQ